jgi:uncharacterized protein
MYRRARGRPVFLYFHGNGGSLRWRDERFRAVIADGSGLVALSYRGYGGSSGRPTETGLVEDAAAAYAFAVAQYPAERIVLWGESLGSGLALATAAEKPVGGVVLEAPFTSAADVGAQHYWFVPVRYARRRSLPLHGHPIAAAHGGKIVKHGVVLSATVVPEGDRILPPSEPAEKFWPLWLRPGRHRTDAVPGTAAARALHLGLRQTWKRRGG